MYGVRLHRKGSFCMKRMISLSLICAMLLMGCGSQRGFAAQTPEETINTAFSALKNLDMETFNACTNNKTGTGYKMFSDLFLKKDNAETRQQLAEAMVENLSWEINAVHESGQTATVDVTLHNKDFSDAIGMFVADLIYKVNSSQQEGVDLTALIRSTIDEAKNSPENLLPYLQNCKNVFSADVTINLKKVDDYWQIQLDDTLCDNLTGHLNSANFSKDVSAKISAAEELLNRNLERWGVDVDEQANQWVEQLEAKLEQIFK